jgi:hypothetical protein
MNSERFDLAAGGCICQRRCLAPLTAHAPQKGRTHLPSSDSLKLLLTSNGTVRFCISWSADDEHTQPSKHRSWMRPAAKHFVLIPQRQSTVIFLHFVPKPVQSYLCLTFFCPFDVAITLLNVAESLWPLFRLPGSLELWLSSSASVGDSGHGRKQRATTRRWICSRRRWRSWMIAQKTARHGKKRLMRRLVGCWRSLLTACFASQLQLFTSRPHMRTIFPMQRVQRQMRLPRRLRRRRLPRAALWLSGPGKGPADERHRRLQVR